VVLNPAAILVLVTWKSVDMKSFELVTTQSANMITHPIFDKNAAL
jgi:hypothetical protein